MSSDILPHKALNDLESMHYYLKQKLLSSKQVTDLIPFIHVFSNIDQLKQQLLTSLNQQYESEKAEEKTTDGNVSTSKLRSCFMSLFSLNGIPSDIIHAKIISFLPCKEYKKLPILSSHFRNVMKNHQFLFNDHQYSIRLSFNSNKLSLQSNSKLTIKHAGHCIDVRSHKKIDNFDPNQNDRIISFDKLKHWVIMRQYYFGIERQSDVSLILKDRHNDKCLQLLHKYNKSIEKLTITAREKLHKDIISNILNVPNSFNQLRILTVTGIYNIAIRFGDNAFQNLQCIDISTKFYPNTIQNIHDGLVHVGNSLQFIRIENTGSRLRAAKNAEALQFGANIKWILMKNLTGFKMDLSECTKLIGVKLFGVDLDGVIWPKDGHVIPFACLCDAEQSTAWKDGVLSMQLNVKFILLLKVIRQENNADDWGYSRVLKKEVFNDDKDITKRVRIDNVMNKLNDIDDLKQDNDDNDLCLILDKTDIDQDLWKKILKYVYKDNNLYNMKVDEYRKLFKLNSINWIKVLESYQS